MIKKPEVECWKFSHELNELGIEPFVVFHHADDTVLFGSGDEFIVVSKRLYSGLGNEDCV